MRGQIQKFINDWTECTLDNLCSLRNEICEPINSESDRYIGLEHIDSGKFFLNRHGSPKEVRSSKNRFAKNDILYGKLRPYLDKAVVAESDGICSTDILVFKSKSNVPSIFITGILHSERFIQYANQTTHGVNHPRTSWKSLKDFELRIPSSIEQRKIAAVLFKIQKAIEIREKIIETTRELKKSTMQHVFTYGLRGERTKETEIGITPDSWCYKTLGELTEISYGIQAAVANAKDSAIGTPILTNINITKDGNIDISTLRYYAVPKDKRVRLILKKGDLLFNWRSGSQSHVGKTAFFNLDGEYTYSSFILRFRVHNEPYNLFLYYYFNYIKQSDFFSNRRNVSSINSVYNASLAATIPVYFPPNIGEQKEIVSILKTIDKKIEIHNEKKSALQDLFKTMLNKFLTGEIRVKDLELDASEIDTISF